MVRSTIATFFICSVQTVFMLLLHKQDANEGRRGGLCGLGICAAIGFRGEGDGSFQHLYYLCGQFI